MENRKRPIAKRIWFSEGEWSKVEAKMGRASAINFSAFAAEMLLQGEVKTYDFSNYHAEILCRGYYRRRR